MASNTLRQAVYARYQASPVLMGIFGPDNIMVNFTPDGPKGNLFLVIRWGVTIRGIGNVNQVDLTCWAYNREPDYGPIEDALMEIRRILPTMEGIRMSSTEAISGVGYNGDSDDLYDDGYRAHYRNTSHTITASGS